MVIYVEKVNQLLKEEISEHDKPKKDVHSLLETNGINIVNNDGDMSLGSEKKNNPNEGVRK
jgi:hypothetical protein